MPGEGSIFRLGNGRWRAQVSIGPRGNRRFVTRTTSTEREARAALEELRADRRAGVSRSRLTTGAFLEWWVDSVRNIRPTTRAGYRAAIRYHLVPTIGSLRLADLAPLHVEEMLAALEPRMSAKSLRNVHAVLRRALTAAVRAGHVSRNVAGREYVDAPRVVVDEPDAFSVDEIRRLLAAIRGDRLEALLRLALGTGLRQGELLGLAWQDVDLERGELRVRYELARVDGAYRRVEPKTERSRRLVPLAPSIVDALRAHRQQTIDAGFVPAATGPVFTNRSGGPLSGSWLTHRLYALEDAAGTRRLPFKNLRSTFASRLFEAGVPDRVIADLLGHTRTKTTQRHYIATTGSSQAAAVAAAEALVG